jgi:lipopolysaccharide/colanic/teichoic acid biosynthesis glycosyltransferase
MMAFRRVPPNSPIDRTLDVAIALMAMVVVLPLMVLIALLVRLSLGTPVLYVQRRSGRRAQPFIIHKFRTMTDACDGDGLPLPDAERTPPIGRLLRRSHLDEIPQVFNLLAGDMSLIGPRPLLPETIAAFGADGVERGSVRPGLTGWAQVCGGSTLDNHDKLALDLWYIRHRTRRLDLVVLARTVRTVLLGEHVVPDCVAQAHRQRRSSLQ